MGHEIYSYIDKEYLPNGSTLVFIPAGRCANAGKFRVHGERKPRHPPTTSSCHGEVSAPSPLALGAKRNRPTVSYVEPKESDVGWAAGSSSGCAGASPRKKKAVLQLGAPQLSSLSPRGGASWNRATPERPANPFCTSGKANCYCRTGRARAVYRVDPTDGTVLAEYCSVANAAMKLRLTGPKIVTSLTQGTACGDHTFRYKLEGEEFKRVPKPVLLLHRMTGAVVREYASAKEAALHLGISNSQIGHVCNGGGGDVDGHRFRWKNAAAAGVREAELNFLVTGGSVDEFAAPSPDEVAAAAAAGVVPGKTEVLQLDPGRCSPPRAGVVVCVRIHDKLAATATAAAGAAATATTAPTGDGGSAAEVTPTEVDHVVATAGEGSSSRSSGGGGGRSSIGGTSTGSTSSDSSTATGPNTTPAALAARAWFYVRFEGEGEGLVPLRAAAVASMRIAPPPPAAALPRWPRGGTARYRFDELNRVVRVDVSGLPTVHPADEAFIGALMDRPDVTLVVKGLAEGLTPHLWSEPYLRARCGGLAVHKLRTFHKVPTKASVLPPRAGGDDSSGGAGDGGGGGGSGSGSGYDGGGGGAMGELADGGPVIREYGGGDNGSVSAAAAIIAMDEASEPCADSVPGSAGSRATVEAAPGPEDVAGGCGGSGGSSGGSNSGGGGGSNGGGSVEAAWKSLRLSSFLDYLEARDAAHRARRSEVAAAMADVEAATAATAASAAVAGAAPEAAGECTGVAAGVERREEEEKKEATALLFSVVYDDGDYEGGVAPSRVEALDGEDLEPLGVGSRVRADFEGRGKWFPGTVDAVTTELARPTRGPSRPEVASGAAADGAAAAARAAAAVERAAVERAAAAPGPLFEALDHRGAPSAVDVLREGL